MISKTIITSIKDYTNNNNNKKIIYNDNRIL